ncbi:MAG: MATE family efflux transporter, partial [Bullifex sp.]
MSLVRDTFRDRTFLSKLFKLAFPIALQAMLLSCVAASDTIMLGSLEQNAMSAVSLASQIQFVQNMIVTGVVSAFQILGAQYAGKRDKDTLNRLLCMSLRTCAVVSLLFSLLCFLCPSSLMRIFTNEEALIAIGEGYLRIASVSYLIAGITQCLLALIKLGANTAVVARISGVAVLMNIGLNCVFIFGLFGFRAMGVAGAALATVSARVVELVLSVIFAWRDDFIHPDLSKVFSFSKELSLDFIRQLLPLMGAYLLWTIGFTSYSAFMGHMGVDAAAANSVASVVRSMVSSFMKGLAGGAAIMVGYELGQGHLERAGTYGDRLVFLSVICGILSGLMILGSIPLALSVVKLSPGAVQDFIT